MNSDVSVGVSTCHYIGLCDMIPKFPESPHIRNEVGPEAHRSISEVHRVKLGGSRGQDKELI